MFMNKQSRIAKSFKTLNSFPRTPGVGWVTLASELLLDEDTRQEAITQELIPQMVDILASGPDTPLEEIMSHIDNLSRFDSLARIITSVKGYQRVIQAFVAAPNFVKREAIKMLRRMLTRSDEIRGEVAIGAPHFIEALVECAAIDKEMQLDVAGVILLVAPKFPESQEALELVKKAVDEALKSPFPNLRNRGLDCLMEAAALYECRPMLLRLGVKELVMPFAEDLALDANYVAVLVIALLSACDVSATSETGMMATPPAVIQKVIKALSKFATSSVAEFQTAPGFSATCKVFLIALRSLATNEANLKELKTQGVVKILQKLLKARKTDLFLDNLDTLEEATFVVWAMSFDKELLAQLVESGMVQILRSFPTTHAGCKRGIEGALWNLEGSHRPASQNTSDARSASQKKAKGHVMISYSWGQKERMRELASRLKASGHPIWIDHEEMEGSVLEKMAEAVEESIALVIGVSSTYKDSQACRTEAEYAYRLKKPLVFVVVEDGYVANGWLGALLGNQLWYSPWTHPNGFEDGVGDLLKALEKKTNGAKAQEAPQAALGTSGTAKTVVTSPVAAAAAAAKMFSDVKIPESSEPLPAELLTAESVGGWGVEEVCQWLRMKGLEELLAPFVFHRMRGLSLKGLNPERSANTVEVFKAMGIQSIGLALEFHTHLSELLAQK